MLIAPGLELIDTRLGGWSGITAAFLVHGPAPALVETGAQTSADAVTDALRSRGIGPDDLATIVLTHVHLDHCGGTGILAARFPRARVVVHRRGARHLVDPTRLVASSAAVYAERAPLYGGLDPTPAERIDAVDDGARVTVGPGRELVLLEALGHARHHMAVLDAASGVVLAGDAMGIAFAGAAPYPALPPPDIDVERGVATIRRLRDLAPTGLCPAHYGPVADPGAALDEAERQLGVAGRESLAAWRREGTVAAVAEALERALPLEETVADASALDRFRMLGWGGANAVGLAGWAERVSADGRGGQDPPAEGAGEGGAA